MKKLFISLLMGITLFSTYRGARALENSQRKKDVFDRPLREVSVIVTDEGYYPRNIIVFEGEKVRLFVTSTTVRPSCLLVENKRIFLSAKRGEVNEVLTYFKSPGVHRMSCPTGKIKGKITVLERPDKDKKMGRKLASEGVIKVWMPREDDEE